MLDVYGLEQILPNDPNILLKLVEDAESIRQTAEKIGLGIGFTVYPSGFAMVRIGYKSCGIDYVVHCEPSGKRACFKIFPDGRYQQIPFNDVNFEDLRE